MLGVMPRDNPDSVRIFVIQVFSTLILICIFLDLFRETLKCDMRKPEIRRDSHRPCIA